MANNRFTFKRKQTLILAVCFSFLSLLVQSPVLAVDREREKIIAHKLIERIRLGEGVTLSESSDPFFSIFTQSLTDKDVGAVLILHGMAAHPDWPSVVSVLRTHLPLHDWSTLSIQMPLLATDENVDQYGKTFGAAEERIQTAIDYLKNKQYDTIVLVGYGFGAATGLRYLARNSDHALLGMVSISVLAQPYLRPPFHLLQEIEAIQTPLLDIYGSLDYARIIESAPDRRLAARKAENISYQQIEIEGADHTYSSMTDVLMKRIQGWLNKLIQNHSIDQTIDQKPKLEIDS